MTGLIRQRRASLAVTTAFLALAAVLPAHAAEKAREIKTKGPVTVTSDRMEADRNGKVVSFRGNVAAVGEFTLCSDGLDVRYNEENEVKSIEAGGNVRIFQENRAARSEKAVYDRETRTIVLTGSPEVTQCEDVVTGDRITLYMEQDNAVVESEKGGQVKAVIMPDKKCPQQAGPVEKKGEEALCRRSR